MNYPSILSLFLATQQSNRNLACFSNEYT
jgi:hypothetical protein